LSANDGLLVRAAATAQVFVDHIEQLDLDQSDHHHLFTVRRVRNGETIVVADGKGSWRCCIANNKVLEPAGDVVIESKPTPELVVGFAPVKGDRSDWAVTKLTELGIDKIVALETGRSVVRWNGQATERALDRWRRIAREASGQARRVWLPEFEGPVPLASMAGPNAALAVPGAAPISSTVTTVLIGPEGGWNDDERGLGFDEVTLAPQILRTETAAVAAGVLLEACRLGTVLARESEAR
jgi:16S rRNA (uracil1498-N3)-methyltransferase